MFRTCLPSNNGRLALAARGNAAAAPSARAGAWYGAVQLRGAPASTRHTPATTLSAPPSAPPAQLLRAFNGWMDESGLQYTLGAGTLLGAMRNEPPGLLKWEHDVDVYVLARQASLLLRKLQARPPAAPRTARLPRTAHQERSAPNERQPTRSSAPRGPRRAPPHRPRRMLQADCSPTSPAARTAEGWGGARRARTA